MARTGYPLVQLSIWPIVAAVGVGGAAFSTIKFLHGGPLFWVWLFMSLVVVAASGWWSDVIYEGAYQGRHTMLVRKVFRLGFKMFLVSESFFFVSFFWAWFNCGNGELMFSEVPGWPPRGIVPLHFLGEPLYNLAVLVTSGVTANVAHCYINLFNSVWLGSKEFKSYRVEGMKWMTVTIILGIIFMSVQYHEYHELPYSINDSVFSSCFFVLTGFHASHVVAGALMLTVVWVRLMLCHFSKGQDLFFVKYTVWYWHFVDVIWILVILFVYVWPFYTGKVVGFLQKFF
ncbi:cytochrome c oxidase subunit III (mitochondrion) [Mya arenaria]|uniref:Cytochrome c oxidase subunit 3 n=1 Tax=Mya arenaria TaxID=6604 RepID=A0A076JE75_MYAAR|nr:cytochrome c oxidase subunit III [Mya arenaria]AII72398.1 cytochrome c oxidase subunit III [Mya arenaria]UJM44276.1 cytochrome c oxidase subunit 3 [Mya arenaria]